MRQYVKVVIFIMVSLMPAVGLAGELSRIREKGEIVVSVNREYPPFAMESKGVISGLDVDLAHLLADQLNVRVRFIQPETYDRQIPRLLSGESDIIMAAMTRTVERGLMVNFSTPYFEVSQAALVLRDKVPAGADAYFDLLAIEGLKLGVKTGTTHEDFARQLFPADAIIGFPTAQAAADALVQKKVDAMVADSPFVRVWRNTHVQYYAQIAALVAPVTREFYAFAIRKGDPDFLTWLNLFVDQIRTDGTLDLLTYEYFEQGVSEARQAQADRRPSRAQFLKNRFMEEKKAMIERRRREFAGQGDNYE